MFNFSSQVTFEDIKKIVHNSIKNLDPRDKWMITWIDKMFALPDGNLYFSASIHRIKSVDKINFQISNLDINKPQVISLPVRLFRIFPVGTIFHHHEVLFKSHLNYLESFALDIDTRESHEHLKLENWKYAKEFMKSLSFDKIKSNYNNDFSRSTYVRIFKNLKSKYSNYDYILFRDAELNRFYWFPSTRLMQALMNGASANKENDQLYIRNSTTIKTLNDETTHEILLKDEMHLRDHPQIARLAFDTNALSSANMIYESVLNSKLSIGRNSNLHLKGSFPFHAETSLRVKGFIVKIENLHVLIVTEILQCHGPWPFEKLRYDRETPKGKIDDTLNPEGTKDKPIDKPEDPPPSEDDSEDEFEYKFTYNRNPFLTTDMTFDSSEKNNNSADNFQVVDKGTKFPTLTKDRERMDRTRSVPPKESKDSPTIPTSNISTNENTQSGGNSTNIEVVSKEVVKEKKLNSLDFLKKLCELFEQENCSVDYILNIPKNYFHKQIETYKFEYNRRIILAYFIRIIHPQKEFIICELDSKFGSSMKIITKVKESPDGRNETIISSENNKLDYKLSFNNKDIENIFTAYESNVKTIPNLEDNLKLTLLYHMEGCTLEEYKDRILKKAELDIAK